MQLIPLITIPIIYLLAALLKPYLQKRLPFNLCAICAAVALTWVILLILWLVGASVSIIQIAVLMGMSVTGLMYKLEALFKKDKLQNFWFVRLVLIVGGFYSIYFLVEKDRQMFLLTFLVTFFLMVMAGFLFQKSGIDKIDDGIGKKLDDCC